MISVSPGCMRTFWVMSPSLMRSLKCTWYLLLLASTVTANDHGPVAGGVFGKPLGIDHDIEHAHAIAIRQRLWLGRFPDDLDLPIERPHEAANDDGDVGVFDVLPEPLPDIFRQFGRGKASGLNILDQRDRDLAVRADRNLLVAEFRRLIDEDAQSVAGADHVFIGIRPARYRRHSGDRIAVLLRRTGDEPDAADQDTQQQDGWPQHGGDVLGGRWKPAGW